MNAVKQMEDAVFYTAVSLGDSQLRRQFIAQACANNPGLRTAVEEMLAAEARGGPFFAKSRSALEVPVKGGAAPPPAAADGKNSAEAEFGFWIGPYKLLQRIGEGGYGAVFMAEQEEPVRRKVAVKVIKQGMDTKNVIARFEAERHALALMDHPNIARVLDAGATATGRPYFVMELVCGVTITGYCDRHNLDISRRLELFINICHAVQHAHQKGIIHRDLKPSNILVTLQDGVPVPKVIDFGIAKAVAGRLADAAVVTACEQIIGTPAYMSPEQAQMNGLDVDTRSDIYSLGVLLYELLTGRTPFDGKELAQLGPDEMRRRLRETEPQRPSALLSTLHGPELLATAEHRQAEPPRLISQIRGDLDWIVMKALEKDRTRRYETANGLAMDLERYLANEPVVARPPSRLYRFQKLVHRNKLMFASSATVLLTLVAGLGTATRAFLSEREARREQIVLRERAQQAERREVEARRLAEAGEAREKINQAAILVSQEKFEEASQKLDEVKTPPPMPSFDGIATYRRLGEWLARHGRWRDAGDRFKALMEIDKLDPWGTVTLDYQACGVVLAESGDRGGYQQFCQAAIARYGATKNGDEAARILKSCLLFPVQGAEISRLNPMARVVGGTFTSFSASGSNGWAAIPLSLWQYRCGNYAGANDWAEQGLAHSEASSALNATLRGIQAMALFHQSHVAEARDQIGQADTLVQATVGKGLGDGDGVQGYWFDWGFAQIIVREGLALVGDKPGTGRAQH